MIDLHKERKFVYKLLDRAKMPYPLREEKFQDFAAYFYENISTMIRIQNQRT